MGLNFNLLDQLSFYGAYHANKWNQLIHFIFVPAIIWSLGVWLAQSGPLFNVPGTVLDAYSYAVPNASFLLILAYALFYVSLDTVAGLTWAACVGTPIWLTSTAFAMTVPGAWQWAVGVQMLSWYMQIHPGHLVLEKRKPALLDSVVQAFALAPLFVWFELLFLLGYRPQLQRQLKNRVGKDIAAYRKQVKASQNKNKL